MWYEEVIESEQEAAEEEEEEEEDLCTVWGGLWKSGTSEMEV